MKKKADKFKDIEKRSWLYSFIKFVVKFWHNYIFYEKYEIRGIENIPSNDYKIFAPNHQNGLMDPLGILFATRDQVVFVARADLFKNKWIARVLYTFKILPIFRMRDGKENLSENEAVFQKTKDVIVAKKPFTIFPEAAHNFQKTLLSVKKGVPRIVFITEAENNYSLNIKIVPIGIYYTEYTGYRKKILVNFGKPFETKQYSEQSKENEPKAMLAMRDTLGTELDKLVLNIKHPTHYNEIDTICEVLHPEVSVQNKFPASALTSEMDSKRIINSSLQEIENTKPEVFAQLMQKANTFKQIITENNLSYNILIAAPGIEKIAGRLISLLALLPLQLIAMLVYGPPVFISKFITAKVKDVSFYNTILFPLGLFFFYIYLIVGFILVWALADLAFYKWLWLILFPIGYQLYFGWFALLHETLQMIKLSFNRTLKLKLEILHQFFSTEVLGQKN